MTREEREKKQKMSNEFLEKIKLQFNEFKDQTGIDFFHDTRYTIDTYPHIDLSEFSYSELKYNYIPFIKTNDNKFEYLYEAKESNKRSWHTSQY